MNIHPSTHSPIHIHDHSFWVVMTSVASCSCTMHVHDMNTDTVTERKTARQMVLCLSVAC